MPDSQLYQDSDLEALRRLLSSARQKTRTLQAQAEEAARVQKVWEDLLSFLEHGWPMHVVDLIDKESQILKALRAEGNPVTSSFESIYKNAKEQAAQNMRRFPAHVEDAFRRAEITLDPGSQHPRYSFEKGFFSLEVDDRRWQATLLDYEGKLATVPADIAALVDIVQKEHQRVFGRKFDGMHFLQKLRKQYLEVLKREKLSDGVEIPLRSITHRLGKNEKGFRTDEFLVDLSRLVVDGPTEIDGRQLDLQQTKDTRQGMLLYGLSNRGYVSLITFRRLS